MTALHNFFNFFKIPDYQYVGLPESELRITTCSGPLQLIPNVKMSKCARNAGKAKFSAFIQLQMATNEFHDLDASEAFDKDGICEDHAKVELLPQAWDRFERDEKFPFIAAGNDGPKGSVLGVSSS